MNLFILIMLLGLWAYINRCLGFDLLISIIIGVIFIAIAFIPIKCIEYNTLIKDRDTQIEIIFIQKKKVRSIQRVLKEVIYYGKVFHKDAPMDEIIKQLGLSEIDLNNSQIELLETEKSIFCIENGFYDFVKDI